MTIVTFTEQGERKTINDGGARHEGSQGVGLSAGISIYNGGDIAVLTAVKQDGSFAKSWQGIPVQDIPAVVEQLIAIHRANVR